MNDEFLNHNIEKKQDWSQDNINPFDDLSNFTKEIRNQAQKPFIIEPIIVGKNELKLLKKIGMIK